jgi:DNA-binding FrmR family transcriptional regulator
MKYHADHTAELRRLKRIEGQISGISRMVEDGRYCMDILTQLRAARAALGKVEEQVLRAHAEHCVAQAVRSGSEREAQKKLDEIFEVIGRFAR